MSKSLIGKIAGWVFAWLVPLVLILTGIRILLTPLFINLEYRMPYFPEDTYGMTQEERLKWAPLALDYLMNNEDISFLGDLTFEDGSAMFNDRELSHMVDVKVLTSAVLNVWLFISGVFIVVGIWAWQGGWSQDFWMLLSRGGVITMSLIGALIFYLIINFRQLFTTFHKLFFEGDSWLFLFSDTLIRLFPMRFWQDAFILVGAFAFLGGFSLWRFYKGRT